MQREPELDRAWYNLGLLLAQNGRESDGLAALRRAEELSPATADYPYAAATIRWQTGDREGARAAARRTLAIDPAHSGARALISQQ